MVLQESFITEVSKNQFSFIYVIGKGGFGKVWKVELKKSRKHYAMKEMSKSKYVVDSNHDKDHFQTIGILRHEWT